MVAQQPFPDMPLNPLRTPLKIVIFSKTNSTILATKPSGTTMATRTSKVFGVAGGVGSACTTGRVCVCAVGRYGSLVDEELRENT